MFNLYMSWKGRIIMEVSKLKSLNIKDDGIMYLSTDDYREGYGLIKGFLDTPYANGFYLIHFVISEDYPFVPPKCRHISMSGMRQSPNFHDNRTDDIDTNGKVCLSRLNTWEGSSPGQDQWTPAMTIHSVLNMIRMQVLTKNALDNEPHYMHSIETPINAERYEKFVRYHNIRSNVIDIYYKLRYKQCQIIPDSIQKIFADSIYHYINANKSWYIENIKLWSKEDNGKTISCSTYSNSSCVCEYNKVLQDFCNI